MLDPNMARTKYNTFSIDLTRETSDDSASLSKIVTKLRGPQTVLQTEHPSKQEQSKQSKQAENKQIKQ